MVIYASVTLRRGSVLLGKAPRRDDDRGRRGAEETTSNHRITLMKLHDGVGRRQDVARIQAPRVVAVQVIERLYARPDVVLVDFV